MQDLSKVNGQQLTAFWKNLSGALLVLLVVMLLSIILPHYISPVIALLGAATLYTMIYNNRLSSNMSCMIIPYTVFFGILIYSFVTIILNILYIWGLIDLPREITFFNSPYISSLLLDPIMALTLAVILLRRSSLKLCVDCKFKKGISIERGRLGQILHGESHLQILNLLIIFTILWIITWVYYFFFYSRSPIINGRDTYIFWWLNVIGIGLDALYFGARYYNIYLDLKENNEIITEDELNNMSEKTYLRYYVICGDSIYVNTNIADPKMPYRTIIDTPFVTKRNANGIALPEVLRIIQRMTDITTGKLRFFFGRRNPDIQKFSLLRYFYFLDGEPQNYSEMKVAGEWMDFNRLKAIYLKSPSILSPTFLSDLSRMTTIVLTQKIFDERGVRRVKARAYQPTYNLMEIERNDYDFQDDKWIRIAMFNSDSRGFYLQRFWKRMFGRSSEVRWKR